MIRRGVLADIPKVSRLWLKMVHELSPTSTPNVEWWRKMATMMAKGDMYFFHVCENGGRILGFLDFFLYPEPATGAMHMVGQHFYLDPEVRNTDAGRKMYRKSIALAKSKGATKAELFCFPGQQKMWMKKGYKPVRSLLRKEL